MTHGSADHDPVLARVLAWAETQESVRAVVLTSTRAVEGGRVDELSDWDVILYVTDPATLVAPSEWLAAAYGPVLVQWSDEMEWRGFRHHMRLVMYRDGTRIDFTLAPADELAALATADRLPDALDVGYRVLLDRDGRTAALPPPTFTAHVPAPPTADEFRAVVEEFWFESGYVARNLRRGELFPARYSLDSVMRPTLLRMLEWRAETDHGWSLPVGAHGRRLRGALDERTWREVEATFAGAGRDDGWNALFAMLALFRRLAGEVAERLDLTYPRELDDTMTDYLRRVRDTGAARATGQGG
ncbi:MAG TPA: aminoglycoside 6-adenylyltransferase [Longimicrobium sp.]|nr:aminoglycoside 6-adenylyltransferase [Longimicrobium sp.]